MGLVVTVLLNNTNVSYSTAPTFHLFFVCPPRSQNAQDTLRLGVGPISVSGYIVTLALLAVYVPGGPYMYMNMVGNRRSAFKKRNAGASKKA